MNIRNTQRLYELKGVLNDIGHASFTYSQLQRQYPVTSLSDDECSEIIDAYEKLIDTVFSSIKKYEQSKGENTTA